MLRTVAQFSFILEPKGSKRENSAYDCAEFIAIVYSLPLKTKFRGLIKRTGVLLRGRAGWSEFSPFSNYEPAVAANWLRAALETAETEWKTGLRTQIPVNITVPACDPDKAEKIVNASKATTAKVKVAEPGQNFKQDLERLEAVRGALGGNGKIRIDVNGGWDVDTAIRLLPLYCKAAGDIDTGIEYVEQPCKTVLELAQVRAKQAVLVAADESVRLATDPYQVAQLKAADLLVIKVQPLGGVKRCLEICEKTGITAVVSSALESRVGMYPSLVIAGSLPELPYACGLASTDIFAYDVTGIESGLELGEEAKSEASSTSGKVALFEKSTGNSYSPAFLSVCRSEPDFDTVYKWQADEKETEYWIARLQTCAEVLGFSIRILPNKVRNE